jgi:hypothetical protein
MRDDLALARVCNTVSGVEQAPRDGDKGIIKVGFQRAIAMGVNDLERRRIGYREVIRCDTNEGPCAQKGSGALEDPRVTSFWGLTILFMHLVDNF